MSARAHHGMMLGARTSVTGEAPGADDAPGADESPGTVVSLINDFGELGSAEVVDATGKVWTPVGDLVVVDSFDSQALGRKVLKFSSSSPMYIETASGPDWDFGADDFTLEGYAYRDNYITIGLFYKVAGTFDPIRSYWGGSQLTFTVCMDSDGQWHGIERSGITSPDKEFTHWALVRDGASLRAYIGGVQRASEVIGDGALYNASGSARIGSLFNRAYSFDGYIASFRAKKGGCRYPGGISFSPPPLPWTR